MKIVKSKTLRAVQSHTKYMGCTFYLEGPHCLDDCVFDNCSFRGELHYVDLYAENEISGYPKYTNCNFPEEVTTELCVTLHIGSVIKDEDFILGITTKLICKPIFADQESRLRIECDLPKIKTIDLSAYKSYSEIPIEWFERFPTLERVILPYDIPDKEAGPYKEGLWHLTKFESGGYSLTQKKFASFP